MAIGLLPTRARSDCTSFFFFLFFVYGTEDVPPFFTSISIDGSTESIRGKTAIYCISVALYGYLMRPDFGRRTLKMVISRLDEFQIRFKNSFGGITFSFFLFLCYFQRNSLLWKRRYVYYFIKQLISFYFLALPASECIFLYTCRFFLK